MPNVHLYPTFDDLESGCCPTFADLEKMHKLGYSDEQIFPDYFSPVNVHLDYSMENDDYYYSQDIESFENSFSEMTLDANADQHNHDQNVEETQTLKNSAVNIDLPQSSQQIDTQETEETVNNIGLTKTVQNQDRTEKTSVVSTDNVHIVKDKYDSRSDENTEDLSKTNVEESHFKLSVESEIYYKEKIQVDVPSKNPPPGFKNESSVSSATEQKLETNTTNFSEINNLAKSLNYFQVYIINKGSLYSKEVLQLFYTHLNDCYNILKMMTSTSDSAQRQLLCKTYTDKIKTITNLLQTQQNINLIPNTQEIYSVNSNLQKNMSALEGMCNFY